MSENSIDKTAGKIYCLRQNSEMCTMRAIHINYVGERRCG